MNEGEQPETLADYLTIGEAARQLGVSSSTLRNWDRAHKLVAYRHPLNGYRLYKRLDLERLLQDVKPDAGVKENDAEHNGFEV